MSFSPSVRAVAAASARAAMACLALTCTLPATTHAEDRLEEVVVTARYRETTLLDSIGSISVFTGQAIRERAALHLEDLLQAAPNVSWSAGSSRGRFVQMRGIGDLEQFYDPKYYPSVGLMIDDLELGDSASAGMLFDVEQVEVLRGPQGTRYGASAHAGMINVRSHAPTDSFSGELSGGAGNFDSWRGGLVVSGPLGDALRGRLAVQQSQSDGHIDNDRLDRDDTADYDELTGRTRLQWAASDTAEYGLDLFYFDADNGYDVWSLDNNRRTLTDQPGKDRQRIAAATASGNWQLGAATRLEASASQLGADLDQRYDADWVSDALCEQYTCSGGNDTAQEIFERDRSRSTAEARLLSDPAARGRYVVGVYGNVRDEDLDYRFPSLWYGDSASSSDYDTQRYALYGEYEYALTDHWSLVAGSRVEHFADDYSDSNGFDSDSDKLLWNGELSARYTPGDNTMWYATVARGEKPGGVNTSASANEPFMSPAFQSFITPHLRFDEESLLNAEIGVKSRAVDERLSLSLALFHTTRDNAQLENWMWDADSGLWIGYLDTGSDASSYGAELESSFALTRRIELFATFGWLETEVDQIATFDLDAGEFVTRDHRDQAKSPGYQYHGGVRIAATDALSLLLELEGQDSSYFGYYHNGELDSYDLFNASVNWAFDAVTVTLWGRNLTDEDYAVHGLYFGVDPRDDYGAWANETYLQLGAPRTYGAELRYRF